MCIFPTCGYFNGENEGLKTTKFEGVLVLEKQTIARFVLSWEFGWTASLFGKSSAIWHSYA